MSGEFCFSKLNQPLHRHIPQLSKMRQLFLMEQQQKQEEQTGNSQEKEIQPRSWKSQGNKSSKSTKALNQLHFHHITQVHLSNPNGHVRFLRKTLQKVSTKSKRETSTVAQPACRLAPFLILLPFSFEIGLKEKRILAN